MYCIFDVWPADFLEDKLGEDRQSATVHCVCYHAPLTSFFLDFSEELYLTSFMNLIVVQCPAGTLHPQLHHPPRKLRSKGCHLFFSWLLHDSNSVIVFLDSMICPHDNNCHNSCNLTPQETGCRPRSSASRSWDPGLDWTKVGKYIFRKSYFKRAKTCMRAGLPSSYVQDTTIWDFQLCFEIQNLTIFN